MNYLRPLTFVLALAVMSLTANSLRAHEGHKDTATESTADGKLVPVTSKTDAAWLAKARANYPLNDSCVVSGDKFDGGDMGKQMDYIYQQDGKPDRLIRMCCKDCVKDFKKDPAKYLQGIDDAAAAKAKGGS